MTAVLITGTPGTGKTTASKITAKILNCPLVVVNDLVNNKNLYDGYDPEKGYKVVDLEALSIIIETKLKDLAIRLNASSPFAKQAEELKAETPTIEEVELWINKI